jgi:hypothetical protein
LAKLAEEFLRRSIAKQSHEMNLPLRVLISAFVLRPQRLSIFFSLHRGQVEPEVQLAKSMISCKLCWLIDMLADKRNDLFSREPFVFSHSRSLLISVGTAAAMITVALVLTLMHGLRRPDSVPHIVDVRVSPGTAP